MTAKTPSPIQSDDKITPYQWLVIGLCALVATFDGYDTQTIAFVAPVLAKAWHVPPSSFGPVFAIGFFGGLLGALAFGMFSDKRGRRLTIIITTLMFAAGSLLTLLTTGMGDLTLYRFLTGFGLGGAMPAIIALAAEYSPARLRATLVTSMFCGYPFGAMVGAAVAVPLMQSGGWRSVFAVGGVTPLLLLPFLIAWLPESMRWLKAEGRLEAAEAIRRRMRLAPEAAVEPDDAGPSSTILDLMRQGRGLSTVCLWATFFMSLLLVFLLASWLPTIAVSQGLSPSMGALAAGLLNLSGIVGSVLMGRLIDRFGAFAVVVSGYVIGTVGVLLVGLGPHARASVFVFSLVAGFFCIGAQLCIVAIAAEFYPVTLRATGVGAAIGVGRVGAIAGPLVGGVLLADFGAGGSLPPAVAGLSFAAAVFIAGVGFFRPKAHAGAGQA